MKPQSAGWGRLRGLQLMIGLITVILLARLVQLQIYEHEQWRARGERQWRSRIVLPAERGNLYDRNGRALALSAGTWRVGVATGRAHNPVSVAETLAGVLGGEADHYAERIRRGGGSHIVLAREKVLRKAALDSLRACDPVTLEPVRDRIYPLDGVGAGLIGFCHEQSRGKVLSTGLELKLDDRLAGTPGSALRLNSGWPGASLGEIQCQDPVHGCHVLLTIDADLQAVCEEELARGIASAEAAGGVVLVVDPSTGDILAAAASPVIRDRSREGGSAAVWDNFNFTGAYEPGSVFKLITSAVLLRHAALDTAATIDCSNEDFGSFRIRNSEGHSYGPLRFMGAFAQSSNIYFARAVARIGDAAFYRDLCEFGFGQRTGVPYPAESGGILPKPAKWSSRTRATIAIGQEIAVTPLQLALAAGAVANGGWLMKPRLVQEVREHGHGVIERARPQRLRRVLNEQQAGLLRDALAAVVSRGTGKAAALPWIELGGKTGTAQKPLGKRGYVAGHYRSTFLGLAPAHAPRLVILVMLDEPAPRFHYASQCAAPVFARVVEGIRRTSDWLTGAEGPDPALKMASRPTPSASVPDVLYLSPENAAAELRRTGLRFIARGGGGVVVAQVPAGGASCAPGDTVRIFTAGRPRAAALGLPCPDLAGLSNRQLAVIAAELGIPITVAGFGYVAAQAPPAGAPLDSLGLLVTMEPSWP